LEAGNRDSLLARTARRVGQAWPAYIVLGLGLLISVAAWHVTEQRVHSEIAGEFQQKTARAVETIDRHIQDHVNLLLGLKGLFSASENVTRQEVR
jgi:CHASE1-domain containing sensor protein